MKDLLEKVKEQVSEEIYGLPYALLSSALKLHISDLIAFRFADAVTEELKSRIIPNT